MNNYIQLLESTQYKNIQKDRQILFTESKQLLFDYKKVPEINYCLTFNTPLWSIPALISEHLIIFGAWDHKIRCINKETMDICWIFETNGPIYCSPVVLNDNSFIIGCEDGTLRRISSTGNLIWEFKKELSFHQVPAVDLNSKIVYAGNYNGYLYALDLDSGQQIWEKKYECFSDWEAISTSISITKNQNIVFGNGYNTFKLDKNGTELWSNRVDGYLKSAPALCYTANIGVSANEKGLIFGYELSTGKIIWSIDTEKEIQVSGAISFENIYCLASSSGKVYGINIKSGDIIWEFFQGAPEEEQCSSITVLPNGDFAFVGGPNNSLKALDYKTGKVTWEIEFNRGVHSAPLVTLDGDLFVGSNWGEFFRISWKNQNN